MSAQKDCLLLQNYKECLSKLSVTKQIVFLNVLAYIFGDAPPKYILNSWRVAENVPGCLKSVQ